MASPRPTVSGITIRADDLVDAVSFVVAQLQAMCVEQGHRGFSVPELAEESFQLIDGAWARVYEFNAEFIPGVSDGRS